VRADGSAGMPGGCLRHLTSTRAQFKILRMADGSVPSLDGRVFAVADSGGGVATTDTAFRYREEGGVITATYGGGAIRYGFLVGTRTADSLDFRYVQLHSDGSTASGHCATELEMLPDGRIRLNETWEWESRRGSGHSVAEELPDPRSVS
jgi:hypothetical protein